MTDLPKPWVILELADKQMLTLKIDAWTEGTLTIFPDDWEGRVERDLRRGAITSEEASRRKAQGKQIEALRILVPPAYKPEVPHYWDITSTKLIAALKPRLQGPDFKAKTFTIQAHGVAPKKEFTLGVS